jgi:hypothetical protein
MREFVTSFPAPAGYAVLSIDISPMHENSIVSRELVLGFITLNAEGWGDPDDVGERPLQTWVVPVTAKRVWDEWWQDRDFALLCPCGRVEYGRREDSDTFDTLEEFEDFLNRERAKKIAQLPPRGHHASLAESNARDVPRAPYAVL